MYNRLMKIAKYLGRNGFYEEAANLKKIAVETTSEEMEEFEEDVDGGKRKIYVLVGPPSVGKSTWISSTFGSVQPYVINRDDIVESVASSMGWTYDELFMAPPKNAQLGDFSEQFGEVVKSPAFMTWQPLSYSKVLEANGKVHQQFLSRVSGASSSGHDIVVDMTNMTAGARKGALKAIEGKEGEWEKIAVVFPFQGSEGVIKEVAARRAEHAKSMGKSKTIPPAVMDRMMSSYEPPSLSEGFDAIVEFDNRALLASLIAS